MSKIKVFVRVRPQLPGEFDTPGCFNCIDMEEVSGNWIQVKTSDDDDEDGGNNNSSDQKRRYFSRCWGPQSQQEEVFRHVGVNTVNDVFEGYDGTIMVYGQTGTGKTYSLACTSPGSEGVQPRCLQMIFDKINSINSKNNSNNSSATTTTVVRHSYIQLYMKQIQDLWNMENGDDLKCRYEEASGAVIENLTQRESTSYEMSLKMLEEGDAKRRVCTTKMNPRSSRSHACLITEIITKDSKTGQVCWTSGKLYLIDLAGSERPAKSGVQDEAFNEAVCINQSLTCLGNCIAALVNENNKKKKSSIGSSQHQQQSKQNIINFRESPITKVLQHSLTGHGRTSIIVTIRPDSPNMAETLGTLKFAERAQKVEAQMTPQSYHEKTVEVMEAAQEVDKGLADLKYHKFSCQKWATDIQESVVLRESHVTEEEEKTNAVILAIQRDVAAKTAQEIQEFEADYLKPMADQGAADLAHFKSQNRAALDDIADKVNAAEIATTKRCDVKLASLRKELFSARHEQSATTAALDTWNEIAGDLWKDEDHSHGGGVEEMVGNLEEKIRATKKQLKKSRKSRNAELTNLNVMRLKIESAKSLLKKLHKKKAALDLRASEGKWDTELFEMIRESSSFSGHEAATSAEFTSWVKVVEENGDDDTAESDCAPPSEDFCDLTDSDLSSTSAHNSDSESDDDYDSTSSDESSNEESSSEDDYDYDDDDGRQTTSSCCGTDFSSLLQDDPRGTSDPQAPAVRSSAFDIKNFFGSAEPMSLSRGGVMPGVSVSGPQRSKIDKKLPRVQLDLTLSADSHLAELLEQILEYLEYGSTAYVLVKKKQKGETVGAGGDRAEGQQAATTVTKLEKKHIFLAATTPSAAGDENKKNKKSGQKSILMCDYKEGNNGVLLPDRSSCQEVCKVSELTEIILGQYTPGFYRALENAPMVPAGTVMPDTSDKLTLSSLPVFFYRSMSLGVVSHSKGGNNHNNKSSERGGNEVVLDMVLDADTDFEAWVVSLHRLTLADPQWGAPLDISHSPQINRLSEAEKRLCSENHILPHVYLQAKQALLHGKKMSGGAKRMGSGAGDQGEDGLHQQPMQMFYTLFDIHGLSSLDLYHAQKLLEHFFRQQWLERIGVYQVRFPEIQQELCQEQRRKERLRGYRVRIVRMFEHYKIRQQPAQEFEKKQHQGRDHEEEKKKEQQSAEEGENERRADDDDSSHSHVDEVGAAVRVTTLSGVEVYLKKVIGNEEEALQALVEQFGPEPTSSLKTAALSGVAEQLSNTSSSLSCPPPPPPPHPEPDDDEQSSNKTTTTSALQSVVL